MAVQFAAEQEADEGERRIEGYSIGVLPGYNSDAKWVIDWHPMMLAMLDDLRTGRRLGQIATRFHVGLAEGVVRVAQAAGLPRVVLTGGCFQNRLLLSLVRRRLENAGFAVFSHALVPPNDGGLSLGQAVVAAHQLSVGKEGNA